MHHSSCTDTYLTRGQVLLRRTMNKLSLLCRQCLRYREWLRLVSPLTSPLFFLSHFGHQRNIPPPHAPPVKTDPHFVHVKMLPFRTRVFGLFMSEGLFILYSIPIHMISLTTEKLSLLLLDLGDESWRRWGNVLNCYMSKLWRSLTLSLPFLTLLLYAIIHVQQHLASRSWYTLWLHFSHSLQLVCTPHSWRWHQRRIYLPRGMQH